MNTCRVKMTPRERNRATLDRALKKRDALIELLSPDLVCAECGLKCSHPAELQVDHIDGATWSRRGMSPHTRANRYWREYEQGVGLRALCRTCNASDGARRGNARRRST